jgi:uncharacterized protein YlxW (UPF0749 family)
MAADQRAGEPVAEVARPRPVTGLLDHLVATSLDEDYAQVSRRRAAEGSPLPARRRPRRLGLAVLLVFGVLVATAAVQTERNAEESASSRAALVDQVDAHKAVLADDRRQLLALRAAVGAAQRSDLRASRQGRALQDRIGRLGLLAGTVPTQGPGIRVVVDDAPHASSFQEQVQAADLQKLVNGLWLVGAEAVSVNGHRLTALTAIRDAASAITVGFKSLRRPYTVSAIGDRDTMAADLLDTAGGRAWVTLQSTFGLQFDVETEDSMVLPAARTPTLRFAQVSTRGPGAGAPAGSATTRRSSR